MSKAQYDIAFSKDDAHRFMPWLIGMMAGMAALLLCLVTSINGWILTSHGSYSNSFTVDAPVASDDVGKLTRLTQAISKIPGVVGVSQIQDEKLRSMLTPWFGTGEMLNDLPLPTVLDVRLDLTGLPPLDYNAIEKELAAIVPGVEVDAHERFVASFSRFSAIVQAVVGALAIMIIFVMSAMIAFAARSSLKWHARSVHLLHSIGAEDRYIAGQFQREAFLLAMRGAVLGSVLAGIIYWSVGRYVASLNAAMIPSLSLGAQHYALLVLMPLGCATVAWLATRITVRQQLQRVL